MLRVEAAQARIEILQSVNARVYCRSNSGFRASEDSECLAGSKVYIFSISYLMRFQIIQQNLGASLPHL